MASPSWQGRFAALLGAVGMVTCSRSGPDVGGLEVEVINDGSMTIDLIHVDIGTTGDNSRVLLSRDYRIPEEATLPNTIGIASNGDPTATVAITVSAYHLDGGGRVPLDRRDNLVTQIPTDRVVTLRVVLSAACAAHVKVRPTTGDAQSDCDTGTTCNPTTGQCASSGVNASVDLKPYAPGDERDASVGARPDASIAAPDGGCLPETTAMTCAKVQCGTVKDNCGADIDCGCNAAPAATCANVTTRRTYASPGTCAGGTCSYAATDSACGSDLQCSSGVCSCAPNQYRCTGDVLEKCKADQSGFELSQTCLPNRCDAQGKDCNQCSPGTDRCVAGARETCDATGQTWVANACATNSVCAGPTGACVCNGDLVACNDACVDTNLDPNCGACGVTCGGGQVCSNHKCITPGVGCSDGTRDAFVSQVTFPGIAGCKAAYAQHSLRDAKTGAACGNDIGVTCPVPADACAAAWHLCGTPPYGPADVSARITAAQCLTEPGGEYVAALGDQSCEPCSAAGSGAACCGSGCLQQNGSCIYPNQTAWVGVLDGHADLCGVIQNDYPSFNGVLCCHD